MQIENLSLSLYIFWLGDEPGAGAWDLTDEQDKLAIYHDPWWRTLVRAHVVTFLLTKDLKAQRVPIYLARFGAKTEHWLS
jgi:hypothetical protein